MLSVGEAAGGHGEGTLAHGAQVNNQHVARHGGGKKALARARAQSTRHSTCTLADDNNVAWGGGGGSLRFYVLPRGRGEVRFQCCLHFVRQRNAGLAQGRIRVSRDAERCQPGCRTAGIAEKRRHGRLNLLLPRALLDKLLDFGTFEENAFCSIPFKFSEN